MLFGDTERCAGGAAPPALERQVRVGISACCGL